LKHLLAAAALALALVPGAASALSFNGTFGVSGSALSDPGLKVKTHPENGNLAFDLDDGESTSMKLFRIWADESDVSGNDTTPHDLDVSFSLNGANGPATGSVNGHTVWGGFLNLVNVQWGSLSFGGPIDLDVGTGILSICLNGLEHFNKGLYGLKTGKEHGGDVYAKFSYEENSPSPVPLPAGLGLMAAGMGALGVAARRRKAA
jgi:hypothetical protein